MFVRRQPNAPITQSLPQQPSHPPINQTQGPLQTQQPAWVGFGQRPAAPQQPVQPQQPAARPGFGQRPAGPALSPFAGVEAAQVNRRGNYLNQGDYVVHILNAEYKQGRSGNMIIVETEVVASNWDAQTNPGANKEGTKASIFILGNDSFLGNVKGLILAASGFDEQGNARPLDDVVTPEECESLVDATQAFTGAYVAINAVARPTKAGGEFTNMNYYPVPMKADGTPDLENVTIG